MCISYSLCILDTLELAHVKTGQISEERIAIVKMTIHHRIRCQDNSLICWILSKLPEIKHFNRQILQILETWYVKEKFASYQTPRFITPAGWMKLSRILTEVGI